VGRGAENRPGAPEGKERSSGAVLTCDKSGDGRAGLSFFGPGEAVDDGADCGLLGGGQFGDLLGKVDDFGRDFGPGKRLWRNTFDLRLGNWLPLRRLRR